jgi:8-amino-7-oxononanoate synthase
LKSINLNQRLGRTVNIGKNECLFFSGTSYLAIDQDRHYEAVLFDCIRRYGFNHGLSRVNNVRLSVFEEFEEYFAKHAKAESSAVMSSGYLAGISALQYLFPKSDQCLELSDQLSSQQILILGNAVDPLKAEIHEYSWVNEIAKKHKVSVLIDDSHAFGILGKSVFGTYSIHSNPSYNLVVSGSLGKGLAMPAGIVLGKKEVLEGIKNQAIFTGASPGSPANLQAFLETQDIYKSQSQKIRDFSGIFNQETESLSTISGSANFPVFILKNPEWAEELEKMGFLISSFSYPTASSPKISRVVVSAGHTLWDLMALNEGLHKLSGKK